MKWIKNILKKIKSLFVITDDKLKTLTKLAIKITNAIKVVVDSPVDDFIAEIVKTAIKGNADDIVIDEAIVCVKKELPIIISKLAIIDSTLSIEDPYKKANAIIGQIKFASDEQKNIFYHSLATTLIEQLSDGKFTFGECCVIAEMVYQEMKKNKEL